MLKRIVFYPVLFSIDPILMLLTGNLSSILLHQMFPSIILVLFCALSLFFVVNKKLKDIHRAGFITYMAIFWFFHYGIIYSFTKVLHITSFTSSLHWVLLPVWTAIPIFLSSRMVWKKVSSPQTITLFLNIIGIIITSYSVIRISADFLLRNIYSPNNLEAHQITMEISPSAEKPDIYYIIVDGYGRGDILKELYNFDNSNFLQDLQERGFYVATQSQSNYMQTFLSLSSTLNMTFLPEFPKWIPDRGLLMGMVKHSNVGEIFRQLGYKFVTISTGYTVSEIIDTDYHFVPTGTVKSNDLVGLLLNNSILVVMIESKWIDPPFTHNYQAENRIEYTFTTLGNEIPLIDGPKFIFIHLTIPHPPFILNQSEVIDPDAPYILFDGNTYTEQPSIYISGYINQLEYVNSNLIRTIDGILKLSSTPPVIIIQADHGPGAYLDINSVKNTCLRERFSILNAIYIPDGYNKVLHSDITSVNTFPIILNNIFGTSIELQDNKQLYSTWSKPYDLIDVSIQSKEECDVP